MWSPLQSGDVSALSANLAFGSGILGLFFPLIQGAAVVLVSRSVARDLAELVRIWETSGVTRIVLVAPQMRQVLLLGKDVSRRLKKITMIGLSGAVLTPEMLPAIHELFPQAKLMNAYSCVEVGTMATLWETVPGRRDRSLSVGSVLPNMSVFILGPKLNPLPFGMPGEIYVASSALSRGYLNRPELTRKHFLANPFGGPERLYRTGDIGRFLPNGDLQYLGRIDNQVKVRGIRIELEEIEAILQTHGDVQQAAVIATPQAGDARLVAFASAKPGRSLRAAALRQYLTDRLPGYMVPAMLLVLESFPTTANGKIDRQSLPVLADDRRNRDAEYVAPGDPLESSMAAIWQQELGLERVGVADHFLEAGGDSLIAVKIALRVQERFGYELPVGKLFEHPTIRELVREIF